MRSSAGSASKPRWSSSRALRASPDRLPTWRRYSGNRAAAIARELTKLHEEMRRGRLADLADHYREHRTTARRGGDCRRTARAQRAGRRGDRSAAASYARPSSACATRRQTSPPRPACRAASSIAALSRSGTQEAEAAAARPQTPPPASATPRASCGTALPLASAAARLAHCRARLALPLRRDRHHRAARQGARGDRGEVARRNRRRRRGARTAAETAHRPRRRGFPAHAPGSRPARPAIRSNAGRPASAATPLARGLAGRQLKLPAPPRDFAYCPVTSDLDAIWVCRTMHPWGSAHRGSARCINCVRFAFS